MITNNLKVNTKVNKFVQRSTSLIIKDLKVNIRFFAVFSGIGQDCGRRSLPAMK